MRGVGAGMALGWDCVRASRALDRVANTGRPFFALRVLLVLCSGGESCASSSAVGVSPEDGPESDGDGNPRISSIAEGRVL